MRLKVEPFYANWAVIGNVIAGAKLSFDQLDMRGRTFTGYYQVSFFGTGNAAGSGYYRARFEAVKPAVDPGAVSESAQASAER
ncbi:MAG: hypothetical protein AAFX76_13985 [Planctomycetota bacterium]